MSGNDIRRQRGPSERLYGLLLLLYPDAFRARFGDDMRDLFRDQHRAARTRGGWRGVLTLWLHTVPALLEGAALERRDARAERAVTTARMVHLTGSVPMFEHFAADLRLAGRSLRRSPVFTLVTVLVVSLGAGAVATIFSAMNALALRPLPGARDAGSLVAIEGYVRGDEGRRSASYHYVQVVRERARTIDGVGAWTRVALTMSAGGEGRALYGNLVNGDYFRTLGVQPALGRLITAAETRTPMADPIIVVSHRVWSTQLGADSAAIGRTVAVNGRPYTLVGVTPPEFRGVWTPIMVDAWVPITMQPHLRPDGGDLRDHPWLHTFARLRDGTTREGALAELGAITAAFAAETNVPADVRARMGVRLEPMTGLPSDARAALLGFAGLLLGAAMLVLLIAGINVASMLSARAMARRREMALRTALGAPRGRLIRQLLTETLLLFGAGALGGVALATLATAGLERLRVPGDASISLELSPDARVLGVAVLVSLAAGLVCGLAPALTGAARDIGTRLRDGGAAGGRRRSRLGDALVVGQLALSLVLLVVAGLFVRALDRGGRVHPGFEVEGVLTTAFDPDSWGYDEARGRAFYAGLRERLTATPGVEAMAFAELLPLTMSNSSGEIHVDRGASGATGADDAPIRVELNRVDGGYFDALLLPLLRGRAFATADDSGAARVAIVNETLARRAWPDGDAIGRTFRWGRTPVTVVGIVRDSKYQSIGEVTPPFMYVPAAQHWTARQSLLVRLRSNTAAERARVADAVRQAALAVDPAIPRPTVTTLAEETSIVLLPQRVAAIVTGVLGGIGLVLAAVGLYGLIAYAVSRRTREIGVRVALGARRQDVLRLIVGGGMRLTALGVAIGLVLAAAATRLLTGLLLGVSPLDAFTFVGMASVFVAIALVASWLPARRAASADPVTALRAE